MRMFGRIAAFAHGHRNPVPARLRLSDPSPSLGCFAHAGGPNDHLPARPRLRHPRPMQILHPPRLAENPLERYGAAKR